MSKQSPTRKTVALLIAVALVTVLATRYTWADEGHAGHNHSRQGHASDSTAHHGGQVAKTKAYCFEVVYQPKETRIYLYDHNHKHLTMRGVSGQAVMQMRGSDKVYRLPVQFVAASSQSKHDYLAVLADVSHVRDGDMTMTFDLDNLPVTQQRRATFTQTFALSRLMVTLARLTDADRAGIARQQVCPVMGTQLGGHGMPIKAMVGNQPIYLCCEGCIGKLQKEPQKYLAKLANARGS